MLCGCVGNDAVLGDISATASGGGDGDQRRERLARSADADVISQVAAVRGQQANAFGGVNDTAASQGNQPVAVLEQVMACAGRHFMVLRVGSDCAPGGHGVAVALKVTREFLHPAGGDQAGVGDQEGMFDRKRFQRMDSTKAGPVAEDNLGE